MNTKLLKQKILDLAIRGKLTQQLKSDGTAADLLKEICDRTQEKTSLRAKRGNPSPQTIIPLDKSEAPFEIPANWEWVRLGDLMSKVGAGSTPTGGRNVYESSGVKFIRSQNVYNEGLHLEDVVYINESIHKQKQNSKVVGNDLLLNITGASIGRCAIVPNDFDEANINQHVLILRLLNFDLLKYIHLAITSRFVFRQIMGAQVGGTKEGLSAERAKELQIPLPPLAEQQRIVAKIEEAFAEIDAIEKNKELLKTHIKQTRQKILDLAIHGKLVPQNKSDEPASVLLERITRDNPHYEKLTDIPFEIPDSWEWVKLGNIGKWQSGTTPSKSNSSYYKDGTIPWLNTGDLNDGIIREIPKKITEKALAETSLRLNEAGSVCIAMYGATIGKIGILSMPATTNQACCVCNNLKNFVNQMWLFYFLKNHKQEFIEAGFGGAQPNISKEKITATSFPLPPLAEQKRIVDKIEEIFASLDEISLHLV